MTDKTTKILIGIAVVVVVALVVMLVIGYTGDNTTGSFTEIPQKNLEPIKVGVILPLSGDLAYIGQYMSEGIKIAQEKINSNGGINNRKLEIVYEDSQADTKKAISAYQNLAEIKDTKIIMTTLSGVTLGIAPLSEQDKVILFNIGSASPKISTAGDYVFRHNLLPQTEIDYLSNYIKEQGYKRIGLITVNVDAGLGYRENLKQKFSTEIVADELHEYGEKDFRTLLAKVKSKSPQAILLLSYDSATIIKQAKEQEITVQFFSIYDTESANFLKVAGNAAEGLIYTQFFDPNSELAESREFQSKYKEMYGKKSEAYAILAYDSILVLAQAIKNCDNPEDTICIKNELYNIQNFPGATGKISFDLNGDTHKEIILKTVRNGEFVTI